MYLPSAFEETRIDVLAGLIREHPLATLVTQNDAGLVANHIPMEFDPAPAPFGVLRAHVARANPVWREMQAGSEVLVVFQGQSTYVTPSWYATKKETGKVVPTWNYAVVHARGPLVVRDDPLWLHAFLEKLTDRHESGRAVPWKVGDAPEDFIQAQLRAIVGIEIPLTALVGKWKMSQNRPPADRAGVIRGLQERDAPGDAQIAAKVAAGVPGPEKR